MNLAIVHYHLNRGGVAQVITDQLAGLDGVDRALIPERVAICHGGRALGWPDDLGHELPNLDVSVRTVDGLDYDEVGVTSPEQLAANLIAAFDGLGFRPGDTIVHVHNHALGKNVSLPGAVQILARRGYHLLLQIHDFAEDFRAADYRRLRTASGLTDHHDLGAALYPQADHIHYAVLNHRDRSILRVAGVADDRLHLLPNAVTERSSRLDHVTARQRAAEACGIPRHRHYLLYPARGIRRKNLGEALLWAALFSSTAHVGLTLPPLNDRERGSYDHWRSVASTLRLACTFDTGRPQGLSIEDNLRACDLVMTTSVAEGFGLTFLEGSLVGRGLVGRNLPEVTKDFVNHGVSFPALGERLDVPVRWIGQTTLVDMFEDRYNATLACYGRPALSRRTLEASVAGKLEGSAVDFGDLDAARQEQVLHAVANDRRRRSELLDENIWMLDAVTGDGNDPEAVEANGAIIRTEFSRHAAGVRLAAVYRQLAAAPCDATLERIPAGGAVLDEFLRFDRFRAVLT